MKKDELLSLAADLDIQGRSSMNKAELEEAIAAAGGEVSAEDESSDSSLTELATEILDNPRKWPTGRERDELLKKAGHDPEEVRQEIYRIRGERIVANQGNQGS